MLVSSPSTSIVSVSAVAVSLSRFFLRFRGEVSSASASPRFLRRFRRPRPPGDVEPVPASARRPRRPPLLFPVLPVLPVLERRPPLFEPAARRLPRPGPLPAALRAERAPARAAAAAARSGLRLLRIDAFAARPAVRITRAARGNFRAAALIIRRARPPRRGPPPPDPPLRPDLLLRRLLLNRFQFCPLVRPAPRRPPLPFHRPFSLPRHANTPSRAIRSNSSTNGHQSDQTQTSPVMPRGVPPQSSTVRTGTPLASGSTASRTSGVGSAASSSSTSTGVVGSARGRGMRRMPPIRSSMVAAGLSLTKLSPPLHWLGTDCARSPRSATSGRCVSLNCHFLCPLGNAAVRVTSQVRTCQQVRTCGTLVRSVHEGEQRL